MANARLWVMPLTLLARGLRHFSYVPLLGVAAVVSLAKLVLYARLIGVEPFGSLSKMLLVSATFSMLGSFGMHSLAGRELPGLLARGQVRRGLWLLARTVGLTTAVAVAAVVVALLGLRAFDLSSAELALGIVHGWSYLIFLAVASESRSRLDMTRYAFDMLARSTAVAAGGALAATWGYSAVGVALAETAFSLIFFARAAHPAIGRAGLRWKILVRAAAPHLTARQWQQSLVLLGGTLVIFVSFNLDRWIAAETLPRATFGQYAFAWLTLVAAQSLQGLLNSGFMPLLARRRAEGLELDAYRLTWLLSGTMLVVGVVTIVPAGWFIVRAVARWMPQYESAVTLLPPMLLAAVFRIADFWSSLLVVLERESVLLVAQLIAVAATVLSYTMYLRFQSAAPTPLSLAWLAAAGAAASMLASTGTALWLHSLRVGKGSATCAARK